MGLCWCLVRLVVPGGGSGGQGKWSAVEGLGGGCAGGRGAVARMRGDPTPVRAGHPVSAADAPFSDRRTEAQGEPRIPLAKVPW